MAFGIRSLTFGVAIFGCVYGWAVGRRCERRRRDPDRDFVSTPLALDELPVSSTEDLWPSGKTSLDVCAELKELAVEPILGEGSPKQVVVEVKKSMAEQPMMPLCQVSLDTVEFDCGEGPSIDEPKLAKFSLAHLLNDRIVSLVKYLDRKMTEYLVPASIAKFYVELVRKRTKAKVAATAKVTKKVANLTFECVTMTITLQEWEGQLWAKELECKDLW